MENYIIQMGIIHYKWKNYTKQIGNFIIQKKLCNTNGQD